jgi:ElaA protein
MHDQHPATIRAAPDTATTIQPTWQWERLPGLAPSDLYAAMALRAQVFVVEQRCAFLDADGLDIRAWHLLAWLRSNGAPVLGAYLRIVDPGAKYSEPSIGRIVTAPSARRIGLGRLLVAEGIARTSALYPGQAIRIGAQSYLEPFYAGFGFRTVSTPYDEDGIAHVEMLRDADGALR